MNNKYDKKREKGIEKGGESLGETQGFGFNCRRKKNWRNRGIKRVLFKDFMAVKRKSNSKCDINEGEWVKDDRWSE